MACYSPLIAFARRGSDGKRELAFVNTPQDLGASFLVRDGVLYSEKLELPCGQCRGCRLEYSRQWAMRCVLEALQYEHNYFVTLTYNDDHLPVRDHAKVDQDTGEVISFDDRAVLVPRHLQLFLKRLRINFQREKGHTGVRFYACGEYGEQFGRPHYHLILFNCPLDDLEYLHNNFRGDVYYTSAFLERAWSDEFGQLGFVTVGEMSFDAAAYCARYMMKKHKGKDADFYEREGLVPEFTRCSRMPGLARSYYDEHKDTIYSFDSLVIVGHDNKPMRLHPPSYFDRLFDVEDPEKMQEIKDARTSSARLAMKQQLKKTSLSRDEYLAVKEGNLTNRLKNLVRPLD